MSKIVAIDLDGTLLDSNGIISDENKKAINMAMEKGIEVVLTSGRVTSSVEDLANEIGANKYLISGNGTIVYDIQKQEIIYDKSISKEKILQISKICEENSIYYNIYTDRSIIAKSLSHNTLFYDYENKTKPESKKTNIDIVENIYKHIANMENKKYYKITISDDEKIIFTSIVKKLNEIQNIDILDISHMSKKFIKAGTEEISIEYFYTEITEKGANKWEALTFLAEKIGVSKDEIITIGDNNNDKEMLLNSKLRYCYG